MKEMSPSRNAQSPEVVFHSLLRTMGLLRQVMEPYFAQFGISGGQWGILRILQRAEAQGEKGLRLKDLGERLLIQPPSVTGVVDRMERQGLLQRDGAAHDLRVRHVKLTPAGRKLVARVLEEHGAQVQSLFKGFEPAEMDALWALLSRLEAQLGRLSPRQSEEEAKGGKSRKTKMQTE